MSNSSQVRVSLVEESTPGTTPTSPTMAVLPVTGQSLEAVLTYIESGLITNNRNVADLVRTDQSSSGGLPTELSYVAGTGDALYQAIRAALHSAAEDAEVLLSDGDSGTTITLTAGSPDTIVGSGGTLDFTDSVKAGDIIRIESAATAAHNTYREVATVAASLITLVGSSLGGDESANVRRGARLENASTNRHFSIEVARLDITKYEVYTKMAFDQMNINITAGQLASVGFTLLGNVPTPSDAVISGATYAQPSTAENSMEPVNVPLLLVGGLGTYEVTGATINISNSLRARTKLGQDSIGTIARGLFRVTGSISNYKQDNVELTKFLNNQTSSLSVVQEDDDGQAWSYHVPRVKYSKAATPTQGPNSDEVEQLDYTAIQDSSSTFTLRMQRFTAIP